MKAMAKGILIIIQIQVHSSLTLINHLLNQLIFIDKCQNCKIKCQIIQDFMRQLTILTL